MNGKETKKKAERGRKKEKIFVFSFTLIHIFGSSDPKMFSSTALSTRIDNQSIPYVRKETFLLFSFFSFVFSSLSSFCLSFLPSAPFLYGSQMIPLYCNKSSVFFLYPEFFFFSIFRLFLFLHLVGFLFLLPSPPFLYGSQMIPLYCNKSIPPSVF